MVFQSGKKIAIQTVTVATAYPSQEFILLNATGYVVAQRKAAVASKATGRLEWLGVAEGSRVKKDDIIARLESKDVLATRENTAANIKVAKANLEQGEAEYNDALSALERSKDLFSKKFVSEASVDAAQARFNKAKAAIEGYKAAIAMAQATYHKADIEVEYTLIKAPFDGVILSKSANVGDVVTPFSSSLDAKGAVVTMADMSTLEVEADVSESNLSKVKVDQPCEIQLDALPDKRFRGVVSRIVPTVDRSKATVTTKVKFVDNDARILPEMSAKVSFLSQALTPEQQQPLNAVNQNAIVTRDGKSVAFILNGDHVNEVEVKTGKKLGEMLEIISGLKFGDKVVANPSNKIKDGSRIEFGQN
jgi:RND family efflux transporter MFP subunit